jgi:hypothetical protein
MAAFVQQLLSNAAIASAIMQQMPHLALGGALIPPAGAVGAAAGTEGASRAGSATVVGAASSTQASAASPMALVRSAPVVQLGNRLGSSRASPLRVGSSTLQLSGSDVLPVALRPSSSAQPAVPAAPGPSSSVQLAAVSPVGMQQGMVVQQGGVQLGGAAAQLVQISPGQTVAPALSPAGGSRLKRPLAQSNSTNKTPKVGVVKPRQRKGQFIRKMVGARRASIIGSSRPVDTPEELSLYMELLPKYTRSTTTNWDGMARAFNEQVINNLTQRQAAGQQGLRLRIKTGKQLAKFDRVVAQEFCRRDAAGMLESLANIPPKPPTVSMGVQQVVDGLAALMRARTPGAGRGENAAPEAAEAAAAGTAAAAAAPKYKPKLKENKGNKQGEGRKKCGGCGQLPGPEGLHKHRHACAAYKQKHGQ